MYYIILGLSILFVLVGFMVTEKNAKYLLSGYNTMSKEDQALVDIKSFIPFFRKFHIYLAGSFLFFGLGIHYVFGEEVSGIFLGVYPILAYIYFIWKSQSFSKAPTRKWEKGALLITCLVLIVVASMFFKGFKELEISYTPDTITIDGMYGEALSKAQITSITLVDEIPSISYRSNGFSLGSVHKGFYKTKDGETIKLLLDSDQKPLIYFLMKDDSKLFYSSKSSSNTDIYEELLLQLK